MIKKYKKIGIVTILATITATAAYIPYEQKYPLIAAVTHGNQELIQALLTQGHNPNEQEKLLFAPLHCCAGGYKNPEKDCVAIATMLLKAQADPNLPGVLGNTPLITAISNYNGGASSESLHALMKLFLSAGADWERPNAHGQTAYSLTASKPICRQLIVDYKTARQKAWHKETKELLDHLLPVEFLLDDILTQVMPKTAEEIQKVSGQRFD